MDQDTCDIKNCGNAAWEKGFCQLHYWRIRRNGTARDTTATVEERFWKNVHQTDGCWLWLGSRSSGGYGQFRIGKKILRAHRLSFEWQVGFIAEGLYLDHLCHVRHCVNPSHLEPVTPRENAIRSTSPVAVNATKTHCIRGHEFTPENTYSQSGRNNRGCRTCRAEFTRGIRAEKRGPNWEPVHANKNTHKTHCKFGHALEGYNLMVLPKQRRCRTCHNRLSAEAAERARERRSAQSFCPVAGH